MRGFHWAFLSFLFQISTFSSAVPIDVVPLTRRSHFCANAPTTVAGTLLHRALLPPRTKGAEGIVNSITWCATGTRTYIVTTLHPALTDTAILALLDAARSAIATQLRLHGDGLIPGGLFSWAGDLGAGLTMLNANNHQLTWGTMGAALGGRCSIRCAFWLLGARWGILRLWMGRRRSGRGGSLIRGRRREGVRWECWCG